VDDLGHPIDGQEQEELAFGEAQLADVDVDVADRGLGEALALGGLVVAPRQARDAVPRQAAVQRAAGERRGGLARAAEDVIERQQGAAAELDDDGLLRLGQEGVSGILCLGPR
jgi:hypothetical protein